MTMLKSQNTLIAIAALCLSPLLSAAILGKAELEQADMAMLQTDSATFTSIQRGIALSLAQCDGVDLCSLNVDEAEMEALISALDTRIDTLTLKQENVEDPDSFQAVLATYVDTRDDYNAQLEKLRELKSELDSDAGFLDEALPEPDFPVETARDAELLDYIEDELELFEDDELIDDDTEWDLPPLPDDLGETIETP